MSLRSPARFTPFLSRLATVLGCLLVVTQAVAVENLQAETYMASVHESQWTFSGSRAICELAHEIPRFGHARFLRIAGGDLSFRLDSFQPVPERVEAVLREVSPEWHHRPPDPLEQMVVVEPGLRPVALDRRPAGWLLSALANGQIGSFDLLDWNDSRRQLHIRLSPVNFQKPYRAFRQCLSRLSGKGFESFRQTTIHFALDVDSLDGGARRTLKGLADYIKADDTITAVEVAGHADDQGKARYNLRLSARRAKRAGAFLVAQGVDPALLVSRHYGESRPRVRGHSEAARAANRRVDVELAR